MINHAALLELAAAAIDFELSPSERDRLDAHLAACAACLRDAAALRADARAIAALPVARLSDRRADALLAEVLAPPRPSIRALRLLAVAAIVAALALGSMIVGADLLRRADDPLADVLPVPSTSVRPTPSTSLAPAPSAVADIAVGTRWERVDVPETDLTVPGGAVMNGVIPGGPGAISWGFVYASGPRIWTTGDGRTWERAELPVPDDADPQYQEPGAVTTIAAAGTGYIATGHYMRQGTGRRALVWSSVDGRTWDLLAHDPDFEHAIVDRIVPWRGELLGFGHWSSGPGGGATPARLWSSSDGLTWMGEELSLPPGRTMTFAAATTDRLWAIAGAEGDDTGSVPAFIVSSTDGRTWSRSPLPQSTGRLFADGERLLTLVPPWPLASPDFTPPPTPKGHLSPGLYRATDGSTWEPVSTGLAATGADLIDVDGTLILVGDAGAGDSQCWRRCQAMAWRSIDRGVTWQAVPADVAGGTMTSVAAMLDGTIVSVGALFDDQGSPSLAAWVSSPSAGPSGSPAVGPSGPPAVGPSP